MVNRARIRKVILERANADVPGVKIWAELYPEIVEDIMPVDNVGKAMDYVSVANKYADAFITVADKSMIQIKTCNWLSSAGFSIEEMKRILEIGGSADLNVVGSFSYAFSKSFRTNHNVPVVETVNLLRQMFGKAPYLTMSHCRQLSNIERQEAEKNGVNTDDHGLSEVELVGILHRAACTYGILNGTASAVQCHALNQDLGHGRIHQLKEIGLVSYRSLRRALDSGVLDIYDELEENGIRIAADEIASYRAFRHAFDPHSSIALIRARVSAELAVKLSPHYSDAKSIIAYHRANHPVDMAGRIAALSIEPGSAEAHTFMQATKELPALSDEQIARYIRNGCTGQQGVRKIAYIKRLGEEFGNLPEDLVDISAERQLPSHLVRFLQGFSQDSGISYPKILDAFTRYKGYMPLENEGRARETLYNRGRDNYFVVLAAFTRDRDLAQELLLRLD